MTYDEKQLGAVLTFCLVCHQHHYATNPRSVCLRCEQGRTAGAVAMTGEKGKADPSRKGVNL